MIDCPSIEITL
jgi:hypothetical protein